MIKIVTESKHVSLKRRKLNIIDEGNVETEIVKGGHRLFGFKGKQTIANTIKGGSPSTFKSNDEKRIQRRG